jgi:3-deoxy-D-manno-octulosonic-acid transferase
MYFYALSDIIFVGGSLVKKGGHNILEPASLGKPVIIGPHMFNFRQIAELFLKAGAVLSVSGPEELRDKIGSLLCDEKRMSELGGLAREIVLNNQGATEKNQQLLSRILSLPAGGQG